MILHTCQSRWSFSTPTLLNFFLILFILLVTLQLLRSISNSIYPRLLSSFAFSLQYNLPLETNMVYDLINNTDLFTTTTSRQPPTNGLEISKIVPKLYPAVADVINSWLALLAYSKFVTSWGPPFCFLFWNMKFL